MSLFWRHLLRLPIVVSLLCTSVDALAKFVNPPGPNGALTLTIGDQFLVAWQDAGNDYSVLSLGVLSEADSNIFWLISNDENYSSTNYLYTVALGNGITLDQGNIFSFILVNGTSFGEEALSPLFTINEKSTSTSSTTPSSTSTSISSTQTAPATTTPTTSSTPFPTASSAPSSGLSTGAKVGIGVGVPIAALIAIVGLLMFFRNNKGKTSASKESNTYLMSPNSPADQKYMYSGAVEAPATNPPYRQQEIHEAPGGRNEGVYEVP